jgi:hypothetical protein
VTLAVTCPNRFDRGEEGVGSIMLLLLQLLLEVDESLSLPDERHTSAQAAKMCLIFAK